MAAGLFKLDDHLTRENCYDKRNKKKDLEMTQENYHDKRNRKIKE